MNSILRTLLVFVLLAAAGVAQSLNVAQSQELGAGDKPVTGRYQLIAVLLSEGGGGEPFHTVMRIDTQTGEVWKLQRLTVELDNGRYPMEGWMIVEGSFQGAVNRFNTALKEKKIQLKSK